MFLSIGLKKANMAVTVVSCYFVPFLFFFLAHFAFPKSIAPFILGLTSLSISSLILYFQILAQKPEKVVQVVHQEPIQAPASKKVTIETQEPIVNFAQKAISTPARCYLPDVKAIIDEKDRALRSQQDLFKEELEKHAQTVAELQKAIYAKDKELQDVKFELYTMLRIESYQSPKEQAAASF